jgi:hypothetical protein
MTSPPHSDTLPPSLPPIQILHSSTVSSNPPQSHPTSSEFFSSLSQAAQDAPAITSGSTSQHPVSSSLALPQNLRKSVSVDSFVAYAHDGGTMTTKMRPARVHTSPDLQRPRTCGSAPFADSSTQTRQKHIVRTERTRGVSFGATAVGTAAHAEEDLDTDSDDERSTPLRKSGEMTGRAFVKGKEHLGPSVPPGELPLPSRARALGSFQSSSSSTGVDPHPIHKASSARRDVNMSLGTLPPRLRSGSLVTQPVNGNKRILINTDMTKVDFYLTSWELVDIDLMPVQFVECRWRNDHCCSWRPRLWEVDFHSEGHERSLSWRS